MMRRRFLGWLALLAALLGATVARAIDDPDTLAAVAPLLERARTRAETERASAEASAERHRAAVAERDRVRAELEAVERRLADAASGLERARGALRASARRSLERREIAAAGLLDGLRRIRGGSDQAVLPAMQVRVVSWLSDLQRSTDRASLELRERAARLEREVEEAAAALRSLRAELDRAEARVASARADLAEAAVRLEEAERRRVAARSVIGRAAVTAALDSTRTRTTPPAEEAVTPLLPSLEAADGQRFRLPLRGSIAQRFGERRSGQRSRGLLLTADRPQAIVAPGKGVVAYAGPFRGLGLLLIIEHRDAYHSLVIGASRLEVQAGDVVSEGQTVGWLDRGPSGTMDLYVELRRVGEPVDPMSMLSTNEGEVRG